MKNVLVLQSGGPTAAINATLAGAVKRAMIDENIDKIYGSLYGIKGVIENNIIDIGSELSSPKMLSRLSHTPSSSLGSCRMKLDDYKKNDADYKTIFMRLKEYNISALVCIGGNDSMDTVNKLSGYAKDNGINGIAVMGAPKTIDNDLHNMDHSPGYPSAALYVSTTFTELWSDCHVYDIPAVTIVEIMGRHTGWLTASSALAADHGKGPDLIYLPEVEFDNERFISDVKAKLEKQNAVLVAVSEGIQYGDGTFVSAAKDQSGIDEFGHQQLAGTARVLESLVNAKVGCKVRSVEFNLMQRSAGHLVSEIDLIESEMLGGMSMDKALSGISGKVSVLNRVSDVPYRVKFSATDVSNVANKEKFVPREWINHEGNHVNEKMLVYLRPLVQREGFDQYVNNLPNHLHFVD